ncbi:MAG: hypothetical protein IH995_03665 [Proteobacteria bacterium]|nr:hypothetical protein [Pseudomonadota bacterium]
MKTTKMTLKRFRSLVEAYGANPGLWPAIERDSAEKFLGSNVKAMEIAELSRPLDAALDEIPAPKRADPAFIKRLATIPYAARAAAIGVEAAPATFQEFLRGLFPAKSLVPQGLGIAMAGVLGIWLGLSTGAPAGNIVVQLDASQYLLENPDLKKDLEQFK